MDLERECLQLKDVKYFRLGEKKAGKNYLSPVNLDTKNKLKKRLQKRVLFLKITPFFLIY